MVGIKWREWSERGKEDKQTWLSTLRVHDAATPIHPRTASADGAAPHWRSNHEIVPRWEGALTAVRRTLPAKLGPAGKVVAVGLVTLAAEVGLSLLRQTTKADDRPLTLTARKVDTGASERLVGESLEEVLIQELEGGHRSRVFVRRAIRSLIFSQPTDR